MTVINKIKKLRSASGFTLVELLVVVSVLVLLVVLVTDQIWESTERARDAQRMKLLSDLDFAIAQYNEDNGRYPEAGCGQGENWVTASPTNGGADAGSYRTCEEYIVGLVPEYLPELPRDPRFANDDDKGFAYRVIGDEYKVMVYDSVEQILVEDQEDKLSRCDSSCLLHPTNGWGDRCEDSEFFRTYALYTDTNPGNMNGSECF